MTVCFVQQVNLQKLDPPLVQIVQVASISPQLDIICQFANVALRIIGKIRRGKPPANNVRTDGPNLPEDKPIVPHVPQGKEGMELQMAA